MTIDKKSTPDRFVPVAPAEFAVYRAAARILKRKVGTKAPDTISLIRFELTGRDSRDIVGCFLDHLRDVERRRHIESGVAKIVAVLPKKRAVKSGRRPARSAAKPANRRLHTEPGKN